jgi:hypothetical protein
VKASITFPFISRGLEGESVGTLHLPAKAGVATNKVKESTAAESPEIIRASGYDRREALQEELGSDLLGSKDGIFFSRV